MTAACVREGAVWALTYDGVTVRLPDAKGLVDLAALLSRPGRELPATELMGAAVDGADLGPVIDTTARRAYEGRISDLQQELDDLVDALSAATGIGARTRRAGGSAERARSAVTRRIREAIRRVTDVHPTLGAHLRRAVRTGRWCAYEPDEPVRWRAQPDRVAGADAPRRR